MTDKRKRKILEYIETHGALPATITDEERREIDQYVVLELNSLGELELGYPETS